MATKERSIDFRVAKTTPELPLARMRDRTALRDVPQLFHPRTRHQAHRRTANRPQPEHESLSPWGFLILEDTSLCRVFHTIGPVLVSDFDFALPPELIAQEPPAERGQSRMLVLERQSGAWHDSWFNQLPELLRAGDVLVLNDSRVIPARLFGVRPVCTGRVEVLLTEQVNDWEWRALTRPARRMAVGQEVAFAAPGGNVSLQARVVACGEFGERLLRFAPV